SCCLVKKNLSATYRPSTGPGQIGPVTYGSTTSASSGWPVATDQDRKPHASPLDMTNPNSRAPSEEKFSPRYHLAPGTGSSPTPFPSCTSTSRTPSWQPSATYLPLALTAPRRAIGR